MKKVTLLSLGLLCLFTNQIFSQDGNTTLGTNTGANISSGDFNVFIGDEAGSGATSGSQNVIIGYKAGAHCIDDPFDPGTEVCGQTTTFREAVIIGYEAGKSMTTGFDNIFIGAQAGKSVTTAGDNVFIGTEAGEFNTTGYDNTFIGEEAGANNTTGYENVFIGEDAGLSNTTGYRQTFVGNEAGISSDVGYRNTGIGDEALSDVDDGHHNTALGDSAGIDVGDGIYNTMVGAAAGVATEWADYNTFVGSMAGWDNNRTNSTSNANRNTYLGHMTGAGNREGQDNVGVGAFAGYGPSGWSDGHFWSGSTNRNRTTYVGAKAEAEQNDVIVMGYFAQNNGQYGIMIGNESDMRAANGAIGMGYQAQGSNNADYSVFLGYQANVDENHAIGIGREVNVDNEQAIAIGANSVAQADGAIVIGYAAKSNSSGETDPSSGLPIVFSNNIAIGYQAIAGDNNAIAIGSGATANNENTMVLGGATNPVSVGIGTDTPNSRTSLDLADTDKGLLLNRMTTTQRTTFEDGVNTGNPSSSSYVAPLNATEEGLTVYDTDLNGLFIWDGTQWKMIGSDDLGNHTATQDLDLGGFNITNVDRVVINSDTNDGIHFNSLGSDYRIIVGTSTNYTYGPVDNNQDNMAFTTATESGAGWVWRTVGNTPIAALDNQGNYQIAGYLNIAGSYQFPTTDGTANQVLVTDGSGALSWATQTDNQTVDQFEITTNTLNLSIFGDGEDAKTVDLSPYLDNTDAQELSLTTNTLGITGNATTIDLAPYLDNTDAQELSLTTNTLGITGNATTIDLAPYLDNTDAQELSLTTNTLGITGSATTIDLAPYLDNTDAQALEYDNTNQMLAITGSSGAEVNLSGLLDNTDAQAISFSNDVLSISGNASTVDLSGYTNTDSQTLSID